MPPWAWALEIVEAAAPLFELCTVISTPLVRDPSSKPQDQILVGVPGNVVVEVLALVELVEIEVLALVLLVVILVEVLIELILVLLLVEL